MSHILIYTTPLPSKWNFEELSNNLKKEILNRNQKEKINEHDKIFAIGTKPLI